MAMRGVSHNSSCFNPGFLSALILKVSKESFSQLYKLDLQVATANCLLALKTDIAIMGKVEKETF